MTTPQTPRDESLARPFPFTVVAGPDGGYFVAFPDLPGCMTQVGRLEDVGPMVDEIRRLGIETEIERGAEIPRPAAPAEYRGKFVLRLPRSLHRTLAQAAEREGVSLNQYAVALLARGDAFVQVERRPDDRDDATRGAATPAPALVGAG